MAREVFSSGSKTTLPVFINRRLNEAVDRDSESNSQNRSQSAILAFHSILRHADYQKMRRINGIGKVT